MKQRVGAHCSFCGKNYRDVGPLVEGPGVFICGACVQLSQSLIDQQTAPFSGDRCSVCRKTNDEAGPLAALPGRRYICGLCVRSCQSTIEQEQQRRSRFARLRRSVIDREAIRAKLNQLVAGQEEATQALALAAACQREGSGRVLLVGPSRSSKVLLARALAHALGVPFAAGDAWGLVKSVEGALPLLSDLLQAANHDIDAAQQGVVYVDGADTHEVQELSLQLWQLQVGNAGRSDLDVRHVLFVCGGTFQGLTGHSPTDIRAEASAVHGLRLELEPSGRDAASFADALMAFGARAEWVRYLRTVACALPLDDDSLTRFVTWIDLAKRTEPKPPPPARTKR
jgi:ATP-dependent Clp protease ATP-binding subunit ClpX